MREALTQLLYTRYPVLFAEHRLDATESGMAWGFQHDDGWFAIVDALAAVISAHAQSAVASSVKQKLGGLRFSLHTDDDFTKGACGAAAGFAATMSEVSGRRGVLMVGRRGRWLQTLAPGEFDGFSPVEPETPEAGISNVVDIECTAAPKPEKEQTQAAGAEAFHQAMAKRLHLITGDCGPVDDQGLLANGAEGR